MSCTSANKLQEKLNGNAEKVESAHTNDNDDHHHYHHHANEKEDAVAEKEKSVTMGDAEARRLLGDNEGGGATKDVQNDGGVDVDDELLLLADADTVEKKTNEKLGECVELFCRKDVH